MCALPSLLQRLMAFVYIESPVVDVVVVYLFYIFFNGKLWCLMFNNVRVDMKVGLQRQGES